MISENDGTPIGVGWISIAHPPKTAWSVGGCAYPPYKTKILGILFLVNRLKEEGFKSIINLREEGEEEQPFSPQEEGKIAGDLGLEYVHIFVSMDTMGEDKVNSFRERLAGLAEPVYVHCHSGKRSGAFTMMHSAVEQSMSGERALQKAEDMGFECDVPQLEEFVKKYVDKYAGKVSS